MKNIVTTWDYGLVLREMYELLDDFVSETINLYEEIGSGDLYDYVLNMDW